MAVDQYGWIYPAWDKVKKSKDWEKKTNSQRGKILRKEIKRRHKKLPDVIAKQNWSVVAERLSKDRP